jgi:hypothetical protein
MYLLLSLSAPTRPPEGDRRGWNVGGERAGGGGGGCPVRKSIISFELGRSIPRRKIEIKWRANIRNWAVQFAFPLIDLDGQIVFCTGTSH